MHDSGHRGTGQAERAADRRRRIPGCVGGQDRPVAFSPLGLDPLRLQRAAFPLSLPAPDAGRDPVAQRVLQTWLADRAPRAHLPCGPGRLAALGIEQIKVGAVARSLLPPARGETRWIGQVAVPRQAAGHGAGAVTRARQAAAKAARSAASRPLAANSSANRRGYRRVVLRVPRHTTVCGSVPAMASRRTVSRETPSRCASCAAARKSGVSSTSIDAGAAVPGRAPRPGPGLAFPVARAGPEGRCGGGWLAC